MWSPVRHLITFLVAVTALLQLSNSPSGIASAQDTGSSRARLGVVAEDGEHIELYEGSYALLIGVSDYKNGWRKLPGAAKDIVSVGDALAHHGFKVTLLKDPTYSELDQAVKQFIADRGQDANNRLIIYFAGHGHTLRVWNDTSKLGYLVPSDAPLPDDDAGTLRERVVGTGSTLPPTRSLVGAFKAKAVSMSRMQEYAEEIESKHALFIFDSCFAGSIFSAQRGQVPHLITSKVAQPVRQFITSGTDTQTVPDKSIFREELVEALGGEADADGNDDGYVTGSELGLFLEGIVDKYSKGTQTPQYGKIVNRLLDKGDFVFVMPPKKETAPKKSSGATTLTKPAHAAHVAVWRANLFTPAPLGSDDDSRLAVGSKGLRKLPQGERRVRMFMRAQQPNVKVLRELKQDERHTYVVPLNTAEYLRLAIEQLGVDVLIVVTGPDGKRVAEVDAAAGTSGTETIEVLAEAAGPYRVEVVPAADGARPGGYRITDAEIRAATPRDISLAEADRLSEKVKALYLRGEYEQAHALAERVLAIRGKELPANDRKVADANTALGLLAFESGDFGKAESFLKRALNINLAALGETNPAVATSYEQLGAVYEATGNYAGAESAYVAALRMRSAAHADDSTLATLLNQLGVIYDAKGQYTQAVGFHRRALLIFEKVAGPQSLNVATSCSNLASALQALGDYRQAEELYTRALYIGEKALGQQHPYVARLLHNLGALSSATGKHAQAVDYLNRALAINEKAFGPDSIYVARSLDNLGTAYRELKDYDKAEQFLTRALAIREHAVGQNRLEVATSLQNLGVLYQRRGDLTKAELLLTRALEIRSEAFGQSHPDVAWTLVSLGSLERSKQRPYKALEYYNKALLIQRETGDRRSQAQTLNNLGQVYEAVGDKTKAQDAFAESSRLAFTQLELESLTVQGASVNAGTIRDVRITYPSEDGARVGVNLTVRGVAFPLSGEYLWVLARPSNSEDWWLVGQAEVDPITGQWEIKVPLRRAADVGREFDIAAVIVDGGRHNTLTNYLGLGPERSANPIHLPPVLASSFIKRLHVTDF